MTEPDATLVAALVDVGHAVQLPAHSLWPRVRAELEPPRLPAPVARRRLRVLSIAVGAALVVLALTLAIAPARQAVADFFGIGSTTVVRERGAPGRPPAGAPELPAGSDVDALRSELARAGLSLPDLDLVGAPVAWEVDPDGETVVAFDDVVLGQRAEGAVPALKQVPRGREIVATDVHGLPALWIAGPHTRTVQGEARRSEAALLWVVDGVDLRLEGDHDLAFLRRVAETVAPVRR